MPSPEELRALLKSVDEGKGAERAANCILRALPSEHFPNRGIFATWDDVLNATDSELRAIANFGVGSLALWRKAFPARRFDPPAPPPQPGEMAQAIIAMRREGQTYEDIGHHFRLSRERIAQIVKRWAPELRGRLKAAS